MKGVATVKDKSNVEEELMDAICKPGVKVKFGLEQQGHISTIEEMLDRHCSWDEINKAIGWAGDAANKSYIRHLRKKVKASEMNLQKTEDYDGKRDTDCGALEGYEYT